MNNLKRRKMNLLLALLTLLFQFQLSFESIIVEYCSIDLLCQQKISYSYPKKGYSEVLHYFPDPIYESLCLTIKPLRAPSVPLLFDTNAVYCNATKATENVIDSFQLFYLPFLVPEGLYSIQFFDTSIQRGIKSLSSQIYYFTEFFHENIIPIPVQIFEPSVGTLASHKLKLLFQAPVLTTSTVPGGEVPDGIFFTVDGIINQVLSLESSFIETATTIEPASWFFSMQLIAHSDYLNRLLLDIHLLAPNDAAVLPILYGEKKFDDFQGKENHQVTAEQVSQIRLGLPNYHYMEFILSDQEILEQRLYSVKGSFQDFKQLSEKKLKKEKIIWKSKLNELFQERGFSTQDRRQNEMLTFEANVNSAITVSSERKKKKKRMNICVSTGNSMDGQKKIWLQQTEFMDQEKFNFIWIMSLSAAESIEKYIAMFHEGSLNQNSLFHHLHTLKTKQENVIIVDSAFNSHLIAQEDLAQFPEGDRNYPSAAMVWEHNKTKIYEYAHDRYLRAGGNLEAITPRWCNHMYEVMKKNYLENNCDLMVYGNARGFTTDVILTDVGKTLKIPTLTELLNLYLDEQSIPDIIVAPSLHSLQHESIQLPVEGNQRFHQYTVRPLEIVIQPAVDMEFYQKKYEEKLEKFRQPFKRAKNCEMFNDYQFPFELNQERDVFTRHYPCVLVGFVGRLSGGELFDICLKNVIIF
jgi:hypothetical protein